MTRDPRKKGRNLGIQWKFYEDSGITRLQSKDSSEIKEHAEGFQRPGALDPLTLGIKASAFVNERSSKLQEKTKARWESRG